MIDKFSNEERLKRQVKDLSAERLHKNLLIENLREEIERLKAELVATEAELAQVKTTLNEVVEIFHQCNDNPLF